MSQNGQKCPKGNVPNGHEGGIVMIDIKFLRENPDVVKENIKKKFSKRTKRKNRCRNDGLQKSFNRNRWRYGKSD